MKTIEVEHRFRIDWRETLKRAGVPIKGDVAVITLPKIVFDVRGLW